jgi:hypothetical protein
MSGIVLPPKAGAINENLLVESAAVCVNPHEAPPPGVLLLKYGYLSLEGFERSKPLLLVQWDYCRLQFGLYPSSSFDISVDLPRTLHLSPHIYFNTPT